MAFNILSITLHVMYV